MRALVGFGLSLALAMPAMAQVEEDFATANRIFGQTSAVTVLADLEGEWLPLSLLANLQGAEPAPGIIDGLMERFCGSQPSRGAVLSATGDAGFTLEMPSGRDTLSYRFDWVTGNSFARSVDPDALFARLGIDSLEGDQGAEARAAALAQNNQSVGVYRVSPDVLVVAAEPSTDIYGRCPR